MRPPKIQIIFKAGKMYLDREGRVWRLIRDDFPWKKRPLSGIQILSDGSEGMLRWWSAKGRVLGTKNHEGDLVEELT